MWRLIRAEFSTHKLFIAAAYILPLFFMLDRIYRSQQPDILGLGDLAAKLWAHGLNLAITPFIAIVIYDILYRSSAKNLMRLHLTLPVPLWKIGLSNLLFYFFIWSGMALIFYIESIYLKKITDTPLQLWRLASVHGTVLWTIAGLLACRHIVSDILNQVRIRLIANIAGSIFIFFFVMIRFIAHFYSNVSAQTFYEPSFIIFQTLSIFLLVVSFTVFLRRTSYLH